MTVSQFSCHQMGLLDVMKTSGILLEKVDPKAEEVLSPEDGDSGFYLGYVFFSAWTVAFLTLC